MDSNITRKRRISLHTLIPVITAIITIAFFAAAVAIAYPYFHHDTPDAEEVATDSAQ